MNPSSQLRVTAANLQTLAVNGGGLSAADVSMLGAKLADIATWMHRIEVSLDELVADSMEEQQIRHRALSSAAIIPFPRRHVGHDANRRPEYGA